MNHLMIIIVIMIKQLEWSMTIGHDMLDLDELHNYEFLIRTTNRSYYLLLVIRSISVNPNKFTRFDHLRNTHLFHFRY